MKKRFSLSRLLHNDKLMMLASLLLAILIWALVVFGPSNTQEQVVSGVPIAVTLNDYATETLNLRITDGANATATVKVQGLRSVVSRLSAADITITADTGNVIKEGTYTLPLRVSSNGDYSIQSVVGPDGSNDTVTISCDVWRESSFPVVVEMPHLSVVDEKNYQIGTPSLSDTVVSDGMMIVSGPRTDINRISSVVAIISDEAIISESSVFTANLVARDADGKQIDTVSFTNAQDARVSVTVPVLVYREADLSPVVLHTPVGYQSNESLVTVSPPKLEVWGVPSEIDDYIASVKEQLVVDFDHLTPDDLTREIVLEVKDGIRPVNGKETIKLSVMLNGISSKTFDMTLNDDNLIKTNVPDGATVTTKQTKLTVTLCGPSQILNRITTADLQAQVDLTQAATGLQTIMTRISVLGKDMVWAYYDNGANGEELLISVDKP